MADYNDLIQSYIDAHPGATEQDAQKGLLSLMPGADSQITNLNTPSANSIQSNFDVKESSSPVTMNGATPAMPTGDVTPPNTALPSPILPPSPTPPAATPTSEVPTKAPMSDVANVISNEAPLATNESDNDRRNKMLADLEAKKGTNKLVSFGAGVADALGNAATPFGGKGASGTQERVIGQQEKEETRTKGDFEDKMKNDPQSDISKSYRQMVLKIAPDLAGNSNFQNMSAMAIGDKLPLIDTMMKASAAKDAKEMGMKQIAAQRELALSEKNSQFADRAVNQGITRLSSVRGDPSVARAEVQRDAAATVVNRINDVQKTGQALNPFDYVDMLGQLYKARSGAAPGEQIMKDIRQPVGSATFNRAWTYLSGKQAPATSKDITASLKEAADSMGKQADQFHEGYMKPHLIKPAGVSEDQWNPVAAIGRGHSYADSVKLHEQASGNAGTVSSKDPIGIF